MLTDKTWQETSKIRGLFDHPGWRLFEAELVGIIDFTDVKISDLMKQGVSPNDLSKFNYLVAKRNSLQEVLWIKDGLLDRVDNSSSEDVKNG